VYDEKNFAPENENEIKSDDIREVIHKDDENTAGNPSQEQIHEVGSKDKGMTYIETIYGVAAAPGDTFIKISRYPKLGHSLVTVLAVYIFTWLLNLAQMRNVGFDMMGGIMTEFGNIPAHVFSSMFIVMGLVGIIFALLLWFVASGTLNLLAVLFGGTGHARGLLVALGFTYIPAVFMEVLQSIVNLLALPNILNVLVGLLALIWIVFLQTAAVRATQNLTTGMSVLVILTPAVLLVALFILLIALTFVAFFPIFESLSNFTY